MGFHENIHEMFRKIPLNRMTALTVINPINKPGKSSLLQKSCELVRVTNA